MTAEPVDLFGEPVAPHVEQGSLRLDDARRVEPRPVPLASTLPMDPMVRDMFESL